MSYDIRLRFWTLCQSVYEICTAPIDGIGWKARWRLFARSAVRGHIDSISFTSLMDDFPSLRDPVALGSDEWVLQVARTQLLRYLEHYDRRTSGFLRGYLRAQLAHLDACASCRAFSCAEVRADVALTRKIRGLMELAYGPRDRDTA